MNREKRRRVRRLYEWFLELPVPVVLVVLWVGGAALLGALALALYLYVSLLARV